MKKFFFNLLLISSFLLLGISFPSSIHATDNGQYNNGQFYGYLRNDAPIHQSANADSSVISNVKISILDPNKNKDIGNYSSTNTPAISNQKENDMYHINYRGISGYVDADNFTVSDNFTKRYPFLQYNRNNMEELIQNNDNSKYQVHNFHNKKIEDVKSAQGMQKQLFKGKVVKNPKTGQIGIRTSSQLDVWDSWPLQNKDGTVTNYHGYYLVFALADNNNPFQKGNVGRSEGSTKIYLFYQKASQKNQGVNSWRSAGPVFNNNLEGSQKDPNLKYLTEHWSGSAYQLSNNNYAHLFYTNYSGNKEIGGTGNNNQILSSADINVKTNRKRVWIDHKKTKNNKSLLSNYGGMYQSPQQFQREWPDNWAFDNITMRDPHLVFDHGQKYLVFEANTGISDGYQGSDNLFNLANYGKTSIGQKRQQDELFGQSDPFEGVMAQYSNAAIGIVKLNADDTVNSILSPLITFNTVSDEIERPNVIKHDGKWYLFADTHDYRLAKTNRNNNSYMLGFVSNHLTGPYKPMNGNGLVLSSMEPINSRYFNYAYYALPQPKSNELLVTDYMTRIKNPNKANGHSTFGPSFSIEINNDQTSVDHNSTTNQGVVVK